MKRRPEYDMKLIGKNLRRLRERNNLSVDEVRRYLCLGSVQAIYKYENGKSYPPADAMFALMELYGADLRDIIPASNEPSGCLQTFMTTETCFLLYGDCREDQRPRPLGRIKSDAPLLAAGSLTGDHEADIRNIFAGRVMERHTPMAVSGLSDVSPLHKARKQQINRLMKYYKLCMEIAG